MVRYHAKTLLLCAVLAWVPNQAGAQVTDADGSHPDALEPLLLPRQPDSRLATVQAPEDLPVPRLANPGGAPSQPLEVIEFRDLDLATAMRLLSEQTGLNIVPSEEAGKKKVTFYVANMTPENAVSALAQANGFITRRDPALNIIRIYTSKENQADLASFREEETEVFTLLYPNAVNVGTAIRNLYGSTRVQLSYGGPITDNLTSIDLQQRLNRFDLINSRSLGLGFFQNGGFGNGGTIGGTGTSVTSIGGGIGGGGIGVTSVGGIGGVGGGIGSITGFGIGGTGGIGTGIGTQGNLRLPGQPLGQPLQPEKRLEGLTPDEIQELEDALSKPGADRSAVLLDILRRRPTSIYVTVIEEHNQLIVRASDPKAMQEIRDLVSRLDVPTPVVLLEVKVLQINLSDDFSSMFDFQFTDNVLTAGGFSPGAPNSSFTSGNILPPFANLAPSRFTAINPGLPGGTPPQNFLFQVVSANFRARLQLLEDKNRVTELSTPLLMTANNEVSRIFSGVTEPITTGFTPSQIVSNTATTTTLPPSPVTTLQDIGTTLLITPNVNADRTVTLRILEENSSANINGANIPIVNQDGTTTQVPVSTVSRQTISGTVVAMDGQTLAFGGLIQEGLNDTRTEVPVLGKVPILGFFFRAQDTMRTRTELVILIRPFVLTTPCESRDASRSLLEALSIHPNVPRGGLGTLGTFVPAEVPRADPPRSELQKIFKTHTVIPKDY